MKQLCFAFLFMSIMTIGNSQVYINFTYVTPPIPSVNAGNDTVICTGQSYMLHGTISGGTMPYQYHWSPGTYLNDSTLLQPTGTINQSTTFTFNVIDANGCEESDDVNIMVSPAGIEVISYETLTLYPNPSNGIFTIDGISPEIKKVHLKIKSIYGDIKWAGQLLSDNGKFEINCQNLSSGIYLIEVTYSNKAFMAKLIKP